MIAGPGTNGTAQAFSAGEYCERSEYMDGRRPQGKGYLPHSKHVQYGYSQEMSHSRVLGAKKRRSPCK